MPSAPSPASADPVVIAIDPHKASWTAVAVDSRLQPLAVIRVEVNRDGYRQLRRFASGWSHPVWAIEGASGLGAVLTARLATDGIDVVDVPAKLARRVRMLFHRARPQIRPGRRPVRRYRRPHRHPPQHRRRRRGHRCARQACHPAAKPARARNGSMSRLLGWQVSAADR